MTNQGPDAADDVLLYDEVPPELFFPEFSVDGGATWSAWSNPYRIVRLAAGESAVLLLRATVSPTACGTISNTAVVDVYKRQEQACMRLEDAMG